MKRNQNLTIHSFLFFLVVLCWTCKSSNSEKDKPDDILYTFFLKNNWEYPLYFMNDSIQIKYYLDSTTIKNNLSTSHPDIAQMKEFYKDKKSFSDTLSKILSIGYTKGSGYVISRHQILVDTFYEGTKRTPKIIFSSYVSRYTLNTSNSTTPCEGCEFVEGKKIQKKISWLLLELDSTKKYLHFYRWND